MPEYSNYLEGLDPVVGALSGDEIIGASKNSDAVSVTAQQIANLAGGAVTSVTGTTSRITSSGGLTPVINIDPAYDAAITAQIDAAINGVDYKGACNYKTVAPLAANVYNNGSSGVGATLTGVGFGALSFDGSTPIVGDSVLVDQEVAGANNGIYEVTTVGGIATVYVLTRREDFDETSDIEAGDATYILGGATKINTTWVMTTLGTITVGTTALVFVQVQGIGSIPIASETIKGITEEATDSEVMAATAVGATGAKLFVTPLKLQNKGAVKSISVTNGATGSTNLDCTLSDTKKFVYNTTVTGGITITKSNDLNLEILNLTIPITGSSIPITFPSDTRMDRIFEGPIWDQSTKVLTVSAVGTADLFEFSLLRTGSVFILRFGGPTRA